MSSSQKRILVIGGGIQGTTAALHLLTKGYKVTLLSDKFAKRHPDDETRIVSQVAGALWEWPPAVCGRSHTHESSVTNAKRWCLDSYLTFMMLSKSKSAKDTGIHMRESCFYFTTPLEESEVDGDKMKEMSQLPGFRRTTDLIEENGIDKEASGVKDAFSITAPLIDTDIYMQWIYKQCQLRGCQFVNESIKGKILDRQDELLKKYKADLIINSTGLAARELADDKNVYPIRGAVLHVRNDGSLFPKVTKAMCIGSNVPLDNGTFVFVIPRGDDKVVLGGMVESERFDKDIDNTYKLVRQFMKGNKAFYPPLRSVKEEDCKLVVGLRPARTGSIRLEFDPESDKLLHNYGHGGSGWTLSWGCAFEIGKIVDNKLKPSLKNNIYSNMTASPYVHALSRL